MSEQNTGAGVSTSLPAFSAKKEAGKRISSAKEFAAYGRTWEEVSDVAHREQMMHDQLAKRIFEICAETGESINFDNDQQKCLCEMFLQITYLFDQRMAGMRENQENATKERHSLQESYDLILERLNRVEEAMSLNEPLIKRLFKQFRKSSLADKFTIICGLIVISGTIYAGWT